MPEVTAVRKEWSGVGSARHEHIEAVCTVTGSHYTRQQVVSGLRRGEDWHTRGADGSRARIRELRFCPHGVCFATPYLTTAPDHTEANDLENLQRC
jgi:Protein of unknown function (DUF3892)